MTLPLFYWLLDTVMRRTRLITAYQKMAEERQRLSEIVLNMIVRCVIRSRLGFHLPSCGGRL